MSKIVKFPEKEKEEEKRMLCICILVGDVWFTRAKLISQPVKLWVGGKWAHKNTRWNVIEYLIRQDDFPEGFDIHVNLDLPKVEFKDGKN